MDTSVGNAGGYDCVFVTGSWDGQQPLLFKGLRLKQQKPVAVFIECPTDKIKETVDTLADISGSLPLAQHAMTVQPYVFKICNRQTVRNKPKIARTGPCGSILSQSTLVLCAWYNAPPAPHKPQTSQCMTTNKPLDILDEIADHAPFDSAKLVVDFGPHSAVSSGLAEFDRLLPLHGQAGEFQPQKKFVPRTARRSRAFQAFLSTASLPGLLSAQRQLHERLRDGDTPPPAVGEPKPSATQVDLLTALPLGTPPQDIKQLYMPMLTKAVRLRKRQQQQQATAKRKYAEGGGGDKTAAAPPPAKRQATGIATPRPISKALRRFLQDFCDLQVPQAGVPRTAVVKAIPAYIKKHNLNLGKIIHPDKELGIILGEPAPDEPFTFFNMQKRFSKHFLPPEEAQAQAQPQ